MFLLKNVCFLDIRQILKVLPKDLTKKDYNQHPIFNTNLGGGSNFIRDIWAKFGISNLSQSQDTGQNSEWSIYDFQISGQSFMNKNFCNSIHGIGMKFGPATKLNKRITIRSKNMMNFRKVVTSLSFFHQKIFHQISSF